jgi:hypothetical protein
MENVLKEMVNDPQPSGWGLVENALPARVDQPQFRKGTTLGTNT